MPSVATMDIGVLVVDQGDGEQAQQAKVEVKAEGEVVIG